MSENGNDKIYSMVSEKIIAAIESGGTAPWKKPWFADPNSMPRNLFTNKPYRGVNLLLLGSTDYVDQRYATFKQVAENKGQVKKGEKSNIVVFWNFKDNLLDDGISITGRRTAFMRYYHVFNITQVAGIDIPAVEPVVMNSGDRLEAAEKIVDGMPNPPKFKPGSDKAAYLPSLDRVDMPAFNSFECNEAYYATLFHELAHSTAHKSRLDRDLNGSFGTNKYAKEELIAEIASAMVCGHCGIDSTLDNSAAYVKGWLKAISDDSKFVVTASSAAQKAADYILGKAREKGEEE